MAALIYLGKCVVGWFTRRIKKVVTSTSDAEYIACSHAATETQWICTLIRGLRRSQRQATPIHVDNASAIAVASTTGRARKSKYIHVRHHHVREKVRTHCNRLKHTPSGQLAADALTKPLAVEKFVKHRRAMNFVPWTPSNIPQMM